VLALAIMAAGVAIAVHTWLRPICRDGWYCRRCHHCVSGVDAARCPECGCSLSYHLPRRGRPAHSLAGAAVGMAFVMFGVATAIWATAPRGLTLSVYRSLPTELLLANLRSQTTADLKWRVLAERWVEGELDARQRTIVAARALHDADLLEVNEGRLAIIELVDGAGDLADEVRFGLIGTALQSVVLPTLRGETPARREIERCLAEAEPALRRLGIAVSRVRVGSDSVTVRLVDAVRGLDRAEVAIRADGEITLGEPDPRHGWSSPIVAVAPSRVSPPNPAEAELPAPVDGYRIVEAPSIPPVQLTVSDLRVAEDLASASPAANVLAAGPFASPVTSPPAPLPTTRSASSWGVWTASPWGSPTGAADFSSQWIPIVRGDIATSSFKPTAAWTLATGSRLSPAHRSMFAGAPPTVSPAAPGSWPITTGVTHLGGIWSPSSSLPGRTSMRTAERVHRPAEPLYLDVTRYERTASQFTRRRTAGHAPPRPGG
jgi:hypothetical protein